MAAYDNTREAARRLQHDAQSNADEMRSVARDFIQAVGRRLGVVEEDAQGVANDAVNYGQRWMSLLRDDIMSEAKVTATNAVLSLSAVFVGALGFLLLNMGVIWSLSAADTGVGPWFVIFGAAWIAVGVILGVVAYLGQKKAMRTASTRLREDIQIPRDHAQAIYNRYQEHRHESSKPHGHA